MKPSPEYDFPINVRPQSLEEEPAVAAFYRDIYSATLNYAVEVVFVPEVRSAAASWPPALPENADEAGSEIEARLNTVAFSKYVVTPDEALRGSAETFPRSPDGAPAKTVFYVTRRAFESFREELSEVASQLSGVHDARRASELADRSFVRFLITEVIASEGFSPADAELLGR